MLFDVGFVWFELFILCLWIMTVFYALEELL